jgi:predicted glycosyltransferase
VHYTGFVVQSPPPSAPPPSDLGGGRPSIVVSVGGGRLGLALLRAIAEVAEPLSAVLPHRLDVFTGPFAPDDLFAELTAAAARSQNLTVRRFTPHLLAHMEAAELSISLFGYNTAMNVLRSGVRALTLPSDKDFEQPLRAQRFAEHGLCGVLRPEELAPAPLLARIVDALRAPKRAETVPFDLHGAEKTAALLVRVADRAARKAATRLAEAAEAADGAADRLAAPEATDASVTPPSRP